MSRTVGFLALVYAAVTLSAQGGTDLRLNTALLAGSLVVLAFGLRSGKGLPAGKRVAGTAVADGRLLAALTGVYLLVGVAGLAWSQYPQGTLTAVLDLTLAASLLAVVLIGVPGKDAGRLWGVAALVGVVGCVFGLVEYIQTGGAHFPTLRLDGPFANPNVFAVFAGFWLCLLCGWEPVLPWNGRCWPGWLRVAGGCLAAAGFLGAASRGATLVLPLALAATLFGMPRKRVGLGLRRIAVFALVGAVLLAGAVLAKPAITGETASRSITITDWWARLGFGGGGAQGTGTAAGGQGTETAAGDQGTETAAGDQGTETAAGDQGTEAAPGGGAAFDLTSSGRLYYWRAAAAILRDHPLVGTGLGTFARVHAQYQVNPRYYASEAHSSLLQNGAEMGALGLLVWLAWLGAGVGVTLRATGATGRASTSASAELGADLPGLSFSLRGGLLLLVAHSWVDLDLSVQALQVLLFLGLGTLGRLAAEGSVSSRPRKAGVTEVSAGRVFAAWGALLLAVVVTFPVLARSLANSGYQLASTGRWEEGLGRLSLAQTLNPLDPVSHLHLSRLAANAALARPDADPELLGAALRKLDAALALDSRNPSLYLEKADLLRESGNIRAAVAVIDEALGIAPYAADCLYQKAALLVAEGDDAQALDQLESLLAWWEPSLGSPFGVRAEARKQGEAVYTLAAETAQRLGRTVDARRYATKALELNPESQPATEVLNLLGPG